MADIEIRRKKKFDGDEDPIVIAQRFLNIFHQLHIFNDEKKNDFNNMILKQPSAVLSILNTLPSGGLLLDYVDDLEQKAGITHSRIDNNFETGSLSNIDEEVSKAKILATALAEAQIQASVKMQAAGMNIAPQQVITQAPGAPAKIEIGADFSNGLAQAIAKAIESTNNQHKDDLKGFANTLGQTQLEIIKTLQQDNNERKKETLDLTRMLSESQKQIANAMAEKTSFIASPNVAPVAGKENHADLLEFLKSSQQQTNQILLAINEKQTAAPSVAPVVEKENHADLSEFLKASQQQTNQILLAFEKNRGISGDDLSKFAQLSQQQLRQAMLAINENRRADTLEIANMMKESQLEVAKMLIQSNAQSGNNAQANNIQINNNSDTSMQQLMNLVERLARIQTNNITNSMSPKISFDMSGLENVLTQLIKSQSQLYKELSMTQNKELATIISLALKENQKISSNNIIMAIEKLPRATQIVERVVNVVATPQQHQSTEEDYFADEEVEEFETQETTAIAENISQKKKKKKKKKKNREEEVINFEAETTSDEELVAEAAFFEARNQIDEMFEQSEMVDNLDQYIYVEAPVENPEIVLEQPEDSNEDFVIDDWLDNEAEVNVQDETITPIEISEIEISDSTDIEMSESVDVVEEFDFSQFETPIAIDDKAAEDWGWNAPTEEALMPEPETTQKSEWEYEEENIVVASDGEGDEWEWEYEEENVDGQTASEEQDWEWEYEEVLDDSIDNSINTEEPAYNFVPPLENANLIDENSPIYSRELYFQEDVYNSTKDTNYDLDIALPLDANIMIKNLEEKDVNDDPYKNYEVKD